MGKLSQNAVPLEVAAIARNTQQRTVTGAGPGDGSPAPAMSGKQQEMPRTRGTSCAGAAASACSKWLGTSPARLASLLLCEVLHNQHHHRPGAPAALTSWNPPHHSWAPSTSQTRISVSLFPLSKDVILPWTGKGAAKQLSGLCHARFVVTYSASLAGARTSSPET